MLALLERFSFIENVKVVPHFTYRSCFENTIYTLRTFFSCLSRTLCLCLKSRKRIWHCMDHNEHSQIISETINSLIHNRENYLKNMKILVLFFSSLFSIANVVLILRFGWLGIWSCRFSKNLRFSYVNHTIFEYFHVWK